ncbi:hypothetical protein OJ587_11720, partial [Streptococcus anginosus]|nr:hypothetical protein [Streptococcus anginosus]
MQAVFRNRGRGFRFFAALGPVEELKDALGGFGGTHQLDSGFPEALGGFKSSERGEHADRQRGSGKSTGIQGAAP